eukprot:TRINITY_DN10628_c0_g1_i1.p1 TRINITY_DN10628_c0_g1~~TRINITY_DN10628_c0_g1_i1.p1  ORF type:complete len:295 (-),score=66.76 TRINITY_DN10628_c0_g1_i1:202-1086(-)
MGDEVEDEMKSLLIAQKRNFYDTKAEKAEEESDDEGDLFSPEMFLNESDKPIEFRFATEQGEKLSLSVWCVDRELQHTATAEGEMVWPAAELLCWYLISQQPLIKDKTVLELGAGVGLASMMACSLGARRVVATDFDERSLEKLNKNISQFKVTDPTKATLMRVHQLAWGHALDEFRDRVSQSFSCSCSDGDHFEGYFDVIIGSDIIYYAAALAPLMKTVATLLSPSPQSVFILANNILRFGPNREAFETIVDQSGFFIEEVALTSFLSEANMPQHPSSLLLIKRKPNAGASSN